MEHDHTWWFRWKQENNELIIDYIRATPSQRNKLKKYKAAMPQLAYAAYQQCFSGYYFLKAIESNYLFPGGSYRDMAASAANAYNEIDNEFEFDISLGEKALYNKPCSIVFNIPI